MRREGPNFFLLDEITGWRPLNSQGFAEVEAVPGRGLGLAREPKDSSRRHRKSGTFLSAGLDSEIHLCEWHRIEAEITALPPGASVQVSTYTDQRSLSPSAIRGLASHLWTPAFESTGSFVQGGLAAAPAPPPPSYQESCGVEIPETRRPPEEGLVLSRPGRFLWLRLDLAADGQDTPVVASVRIHYPRQTFLEFLPGVYKGDEESRDFLNRFLALFHTEWIRLEGRLGDFARYLDPAAVPEGAFLEYLAAWLGQRLERSWSGEARRRLLVALPDLLPRRGTVEGLRRWLRLYLEGGGGVGQEEHPGYPRLVEGFRERHALALRDPGGELGGRALSGHSPVHGSRLRLDGASRAGEARLLSTFDPRLDPLRDTLHRFRVFAPAAWVKSTGQEATLRRALESEKPAHTRSELCLVEPRLRVGIQSTVGIDTIVGRTPRPRWVHRGWDADLPRGWAPRHRLGYDSVLGARSPAATSEWQDGAT